MAAGRLKTLMKTLKKTVFTLLFSVMSIALIAQAANVTDESGYKQGQWKITGADKPLPGYGPTQVIEEGFYKNNRKEGSWKKYYPNGKVEHVLNYLNGKLDGIATFYYKNGKKKEEGTWKKNRWVGEYKYFYKTGGLRNEWKYNETGKRTGIQRYYYENGQVKLEGAWENGKESGPIVEFYDDGSVKSERFFMNGKIDQGKTAQYKRSEKTSSGVVSVGGDSGSTTSDSGRVVVKQKPVEDAKPFDGNGFNEFYNKEGLLIRKGVFRNGYLKDGELYKYNKEGKLIKTLYYKGGKVIRIKNH